jgi:hypothetical protein
MAIRGFMTLLQENPLPPYSIAEVQVGMNSAFGGRRDSFGGSCELKVTNEGYEAG